MDYHGLPWITQFLQEASKKSENSWGVVGRKRVVLLAPDVFPASGKVLRSPDMECPQLKPLANLPEEDSRAEKLGGLDQNFVKVMGNVLGIYLI